MNREASDTIGDMTELITSITETGRGCGHNVSLLFLNPLLLQRVRYEY